MHVKLPQMDEQGFVELENTLALLRRALSALTALKPAGTEGAGVSSSVEAGEWASFEVHDPPIHTYIQTYIHRCMHACMQNIVCATWKQFHLFIS